MSSAVFLTSLVTDLDECIYLIADFLNAISEQQAITQGKIQNTPTPALSATTANTDPNSAHGTTQNAAAAAAALHHSHPAAASPLPPGAAAALAASGSSALSAAVKSAAAPSFALALQVLHKLLLKDDSMQSGLNELLVHQHMASKIADLRKQISSIDRLFIQFGSSLTKLERQFFEILTPIHHYKHTPYSPLLSYSSSSSSSSSSGPSLLSSSSSSASYVDPLLSAADLSNSYSSLLPSSHPSNRVDIASLLTLSQRLSFFSMSAADQIERKGETISRPPIPQENDISQSLLRMQTNIEEMNELIKQREEFEEQMRIQQQQQQESLSNDSQMSLTAKSSSSLASTDANVSSSASASAASSSLSSLSFDALSTQAGYSRAWRGENLQFHYGVDEDDEDLDDNDDNDDQQMNIKNGKMELEEKKTESEKARQ